MVTDADGKPVEEKESADITGDFGGADASDTTALHYETLQPEGKWSRTTSDANDF